MDDCIFCKIANGQIPKDFVYESESVVAFDDINPVKKIHILFIPKKHFDNFESLTDGVVLDAIRIGIQKVVVEKGLVGQGYKIVVNGGGAQVINHLHFHLMGPVGFNVPIS